MKTITVEVAQANGSNKTYNLTGTKVGVSANDAAYPNCFKFYADHRTLVVAATHLISFEMNLPSE